MQGLRIRIILYCQSKADSSKREFIGKDRAMSLQSKNKHLDYQVKNHPNFNKK
jgi:hypothetical protein